MTATIDPRQRETTEYRETDAAAELVDAYQNGFAEGYAAGIDARTPRDVWIPVPLRWRVVSVGDLIVGHNGALWTVHGSAAHRAGWRLTMARAGSATTGAYDGDPDEPANVLLPVPERDALQMTREQLGAQILNGRTVR